MFLFFSTDILFYLSICQVESRCLFIWKGHESEKPQYQFGLHSFVSLHRMWPKVIWMIKSFLSQTFKVKPLMSIPECTSLPAALLLLEAPSWGKRQTAAPEDGTVNLIKFTETPDEVKGRLEWLRVSVCACVCFYVRVYTWGTLCCQPRSDRISGSAVRLLSRWVVSH